MSTLDLFRHYKNEYAMPKEPALVTVRPIGVPSARAVMTFGSFPSPVTLVASWS